MNEILAIVLIVFDTERSSEVVGCEPEFLQHDVYFFFDALLSKLGVARLYQESKDISELNLQLNPKESVNKELHLQEGWHRLLAIFELIENGEITNDQAKVYCVIVYRNPEFNRVIVEKPPGTY